MFNKDSKGRFRDARIVLCLAEEEKDLFKEKSFNEGKSMQKKLLELIGKYVEEE